MFGRCSVRSAVGLPAFNVVGMVDAAVQESRARVKTALKASGFSMPGDRVLVNLAPSSLKKSGSGFDLAIAVGILVATGQVDSDLVRDALFVGELSLDGSVRPVAGMLAYAMLAHDYGLALACAEEGEGLVPIEGLCLRGLRTIARLRTGAYDEVDICPGDPDAERIDYGDVSGNDVAKRALQIAAAGKHGLLMMGPPGSGKTMLASRLPTILPPLTEDEMLRAALIHSVAGEPIASILSGKPPFRAPHHSATGPGLIGGGSPVRPGEISLAHLGVLFIDEIAEVKPSVLQQMRQPLECGYVNITRADGNVTFPASFMLVAASNPCRCGYYGDAEHDCTCTVKQVRDYQNRIGGPLMDRIDIHIDVKRVPPSEILAQGGGTTSEQLREGVMAGREFASWRKSREEASSPTQDVIASCHLDAASEQFFERAARANHMSGRAIVRTLSVARTIADMAQRSVVCKADLCEALGFRLRDGVGQ